MLQVLDYFPCLKDLSEEQRKGLLRELEAKDGMLGFIACKEPSEQEALKPPTMNTMKRVVYFLEAGRPVDVCPGGMTIFYGDAPLWRFCNVVHQAITQGAAVVAVARDLEKDADGGGAIVVYSMDADYAVGRRVDAPLSSGSEVDKAAADREAARRRPLGFY